jgi:thymidylate synthase (FAD)
MYKEIFKPTAKLISITPDAEITMAYVARVSNPDNQNNPNIAKLLKYCLDEGHVSVFEQASLTMEIETHLAIAVQILRHRSFCFQMFSQRYADASLLNEAIPLFELRMQDTKNRQSSTDTLSDELKEKFLFKIENHFNDTMRLYNEMLDAGIAKECARFVLPQATTTRLYITGNIRSWIFYLQERSKAGVQKEHREVAKLCKNIFIKQLPVVSDSLGWK